MNNEVKDRGGGQGPRVLVSHSVSWTNLISIFQVVLWKSDMGGGTKHLNPKLETSHT